MGPVHADILPVRSEKYHALLRVTVWVSSVVYVFRAGINLSLINIARELNRDIVVQALIREA